MSVLKFRNTETGQWQEIPTIIGAPGPMGPSGADYVLTQEDKLEIAGMVSGVDINLDNYYTKTETDNAIKIAIDAIEIPEGPDGKPITAINVSYNGEISNINNVQDAIDYIYDYAIDEVYLNNILNQAGYQTETQVNSLITTALKNIGVAEEGTY